MRSTGSYSPYTEDSDPVAFQFMRIKTLTVPEIGFIAGTRAALGAGVALLLAEKLSAPARRAVGITLFAIGAATTVPAAMILFGRRTARIRPIDMPFA